MNLFEMAINNYSVFHEEMLQFIASGYDNLGDCLSRLSAEIRMDEREMRHWVIMLQNQWASLKSTELKGLNIDEKDKNALTFRAINCVDEFIRSRQAELFHEKILIVSYDQLTMGKMNKFLNLNFFKGEIRRDSSRILQENLADGCDFVLFDNYHCLPENTKYRQDLLDAYLASSKTNALLSFGAWIPGYNPADLYPHKFFAANSPFSLYARIRELREFLKIHGKPQPPS